MEHGEKKQRNILKKLEEAKFYISALERRKATLITIGNEIVIRNAIST